MASKAVFKVISMTYVEFTCGKALDEVDEERHKRETRGRRDLNSRPSPVTGDVLNQLNYVRISLSTSSRLNRFNLFSKCIASFLVSKIL